MVLIEIVRCWWFDSYMSNPERPSVVFTDGMFRPELASWVSGMSKDRVTIAREVQFLRRDFSHVTPFLAQLTRHAVHVEPYDSVLGIDPKQRRSRAFKDGMLLGTLVTRPLFATRKAVLQGARKFLDDELEPGLKQITADNNRDLAFARGDFLTKLGSKGEEYFAETSEPLADIASSIEPDVINQLYVRRGAGLTMLTMWSGFADAEVQQMTGLAQAAHDDQYMDQALAKLLST